MALFAVKGGTIYAVHAACSAARASQRLAPGNDGLSLATADASAGGPDRQPGPAHHVVRLAPTRRDAGDRWDTPDPPLWRVESLSPRGGGSESPSEETYRIPQTVPEDPLR